MARSPGKTPRLAFPRAVAGAVSAQFGREWRAGALHRMATAGPRPKGLAVRPRDIRPVDAGAGERLLRGEFRLGGERLDAGAGGNPWNRPSPSRAFAGALHGFGWMGDLLAMGEPGARAGLRLWLDWRRAFGRHNDFAWSGAVLERRIFNLACAAPALLPLASDAEGAALLADLGRQARHLLSEPADDSRAAERAATSALAGASLGGAAGETLLRRALRRLHRALPIAVLGDGVHATRSAQRGLELLFDLLTLDDALSQRGAPAPVELSRAIDRLSAAARFFALGDGRLAAFHGGEPGAVAPLAAALALDSARKSLTKAAPYGGYQRMESRLLQVMADIGAAAAGAWSTGACDQPGAFEVLCGGQRLIRASAWSSQAPSGVADLRGPAGGTCLALGEGWPGGFLTGLVGRRFGPRLALGASEVKVERSERDEGIWLDITHDAWRGRFGLDHVRRLFLDLGADELRGEDQLVPTGRPARRPVAYAIAFHLAPQVSASVAVDGKSALIKPPGAAGWRLRGDAAAMRVEPCWSFENGEPRLTQVLRLVGEVIPANGGRVRWKLSRAEG